LVSPDLSAIGAGQAGAYKGLPLERKTRMNM